MKPIQRRSNKPGQENNPALTIQLIGPKVIREIPAYKVTISFIEIEYFIDNPTEKIVEAYTKQIGKIVLWQGEAYDAIGDWTNADVENRIIELYS